MRLSRNQLRRLVEAAISDSPYGSIRQMKGLVTKAVNNIGDAWREKLQDEQVIADMGGISRWHSAVDSAEIELEDELVELVRQIERKLVEGGYDPDMAEAEDDEMEEIIIVSG